MAYNDRKSVYGYGADSPVAPITRVLGYNGNSITVQLADGSIVTRTGDRASRNFNPGNIRPAPWETRAPYNAVGAEGNPVGKYGQMAVFPSDYEGNRAREHLMFEAPVYANKTLIEAIRTYAPKKDMNNPALYASQLAAVAGVNPNKKMKDYTPAERAAIMQAQLGVEGNLGAKIKQLTPPGEEAQNFPNPSETVGPVGTPGPGKPGEMGPDAAPHFKFTLPGEQTSAAAYTRAATPWNPLTDNGYNPPTPGLDAARVALARQRATDYAAAASPTDDFRDPTRGQMAPELGVPPQLRLRDPPAPQAPQPPNTSPLPGYFNAAFAQPSLGPMPTAPQAPGYNPLTSVQPPSIAQQVIGTTRPPANVPQTPPPQQPSPGMLQSLMDSIAKAFTPSTIAQPATTGALPAPASTGTNGYNPGFNDRQSVYGYGADSPVPGIRSTLNSGPSWQSVQLENGSVENRVNGRPAVQTVGPGQSARDFPSPSASGYDPLSSIRSSPLATGTGAYSAPALATPITKTETTYQSAPNPAFSAAQKQLADARRAAANYDAAPMSDFRPTPQSYDPLSSITPGPNGTYDPQKTIAAIEAKLKALTPTISVPVTTRRTYTPQQQHNGSPGYGYGYGGGNNPFTAAGMTFAGYLPSGRASYTNGLTINGVQQYFTGDHPSNLLGGMGYGNPFSGMFGGGSNNQGHASADDY